MNIEQEIYQEFNKRVGKLRGELRQDMDDYKLLCFVEERISNKDWNDEEWENIAYHFKYKLLEQIFCNIKRLNNLIG